MNTSISTKSIEFIKSWLNFRYEHEEVPGFAVAIAHKGKIIMSEAYGYADLENQVKLTSGRYFRIASHSKTFTATSLMQLQEQGKLRIDDSVVDYLPWLKEHKDLRWQKVTLRQLMSHSAGVIRDGLDADYWQLLKPFPDIEGLKKEIMKAELVLDTNTRMKYSNYGYSLLGLVIQTVSGEPYNDYVIKHIVEPLGLTHTGPEFTPKIESQLVTGYTRRDFNKKCLPITNIDTRAMSSATGFYSTTEDLCKYFTAQLTGSGKLLDDESKNEMQRTQWRTESLDNDYSVDYGLGFEIEYVGDRRLIGHGGGFPGYITKSYADPRDELVVIVLTNSLSSLATSIAKTIYGVIDYFQKNAAENSTHDMSRFEGSYMNLWGRNDVIATGNKIVSASVDSWSPLRNPEELEYVNDTTLKIKKTDSFSSQGELVHFVFKNDKVVSVNFAGTTMWPEAIWLDMFSKKGKVELG